TDRSGSISQWLAFAGQPVNALLAGLLFCWPLARKSQRHRLQASITKGLEAGGKIILVVGCGGAFGFILRNSGLAQLLTEHSGLIHLGLLMPFVMAALIKTAEGSATVALITASVLVEPLLPALGLDSTTGRLLALFACGGGAMTIAHVNDSFFWVIAEFTGMDTATALKSLTVATFCQGITVLVLVLIMAALLL
ncbi:MAG: GntP family permease, partial [Endozoicomonas sp.]